MRLIWIGIGTLFVVMAGLIVGLVIQPRPSSSPSLASPSPTPGGWIRNETSVADQSDSSAAQTPVEQARTAAASATPGPLFGDDQKEQAYEALKQRREELASVPKPQFSSTDPRVVGAEINSYVNEMGTRAQTYQQAKDALYQQLTPAEQARLHQVDPGN